MAWKKSSEALVATFADALPADARAERRSMFGYPCSVVNGHLFAGLHEDRMMVRLDAAARAELLAIDGARVFEPMQGRPMKEYVVLPPSILTDRGALRGWTARAFSYALTLPPKAKARKKEAVSAPAAEKRPTPARTPPPKKRTAR